MPDAAAFSDNQAKITWGELRTRIKGMAEKLRDGPENIGIAVPDGVAYVIADLAATLVGKRVVPIPEFFSTNQIKALLADAQIGVLVSDKSSLYSDDLPSISVAHMPELYGPLNYQGGATRVIYTSGSSGAPKGVCHGDRQLTASIAALAEVVGASSADRHLSVLPFAQLLEQIAGIFLPIVAGGRCHISAGGRATLFGHNAAPMMLDILNFGPSTTVMVPRLLQALVDEIRNGAQAPKGMRFVALGGAPAAPGLLREAETLGLPVIEGYGLSEACAVVAMNRPGAAKLGTVGAPLPCVDISLAEDREIIVAGPTIMDGYLNAPHIKNLWHTGDLGRIEGGRLIIDGRKDALIITNAGRNISPEWIESRANAVPGVHGCACVYVREIDRLCLLVAVTEALAITRLDSAFHDLPTYAQPQEILPIDPRKHPFLHPAGTPNRAVAAKVAGEHFNNTLRAAI